MSGQASDSTDTTKCIGRRPEQGEHSPFGRDETDTSAAPPRASADDSNHSSGSTRKKRNCRNREGRRGSGQAVHPHVFVTLCSSSYPHPPAPVSSCSPLLHAPLVLSPSPPCSSHPAPSLHEAERRSTDKDSYNYDAQAEPSLIWGCPRLLLPSAAAPALSTAVVNSFMSWRRRQRGGGEGGGASASPAPAAA